MTNPLLEPWDGPHGLPPFDRIRTGHFPPAFDAALTAHAAEIDAIATNPAPADFANTVGAIERSGGDLWRISAAFFTLASSDTTPELQEVERAVVPKLAAHRQAILMRADLWERVRAVAAGLDALAPEEARVTELLCRRFRRAGADLEGPARERMGEIKGRLAELGTAFGQAVLKDEQDWTMVLGEGDLDGLPEHLIATAEAEGRARGADGPVITLSRSSVAPFLASSPRRDLRERAWRAWTGRGEMGRPVGETTWPIIAETLALRAELARLLGFGSYAAFKLEDQMAKTPGAVRGLIDEVWHPAVAKAGAEHAALEKIAAEDGINGPIEPWDWRYYAEKHRQRAFALDDAELKPYLPLEGIIEAAFDVAGRLFGLSFRERTDLTLPHPDARAWEVLRDGRLIGLFVGDYFARPSKRSGAWASGLRPQQRVWELETPVILNTMNFAKGDPTLLSLDDARTLFHEFGHALHGLLSDVTHPSISGTAVARDFVELPSQLYEHWLTVPEVLTAHARHYRTGTPIPAELIAKAKAAENAGSGFDTVEYLASAMVDLAMHDGTAETGEGFDGPAFEATVLADAGMPHAIAMRHRSPHFLHVFAGDGYSAGYYSYMWSEMMDADAFRAFEEAGDVFDPATARALEAHVLSAGNRQEADAAYVAFRGQMPGTAALLEGRGLATPEPA